MFAVRKLVSSPHFAIRTFKTSTAAKMPIKEGDKLPSVELYEDNPANRINIADLTAGKKSIIFAVPGAFTPGCSRTHLPSFLQKSEEFRTSGVKEIICVSVNDPFVMSAWGLQNGTTNKIRMLADPSAEFTKAVEMAIDISPLGGLRSKRYSMTVEDGKVVSLQVEPDGTGLSCSLADRIKI